MSYKQQSKANQRPYWHYDIASRKLESMLADLLPNLRLKRPTAAAAIAYIRTASPRGMHLTKKTRAARQQALDNFREVCLDARTITYPPEGR